MYIIVGIDAEHMLFMGSTKFPDENEVSTISLYEIFAVYSESISPIIYRLHVHFIPNGTMHNCNKFYLKVIASCNYFPYRILFEASGRQEPDSNGDSKLELTSLCCMQYDKFLSQHGGSSNAYTDQEFTCYHFEVINKCFRDALERWTKSLTTLQHISYFLMINLWAIKNQTVTVRF